MKLDPRIGYWLWQTLFWGAYTAIGISNSAAVAGWTLPLVAGYLLFFGYTLVLTDWLRRQVLRRNWVDAPSARSRVKAAGMVAAVGAIQTALVTGIDFAFLQRRSSF